MCVRNLTTIHDILESVKNKRNYPIPLKSPAAVHHRQVVHRNPETQFLEQESPNGFEGPPSGFWKIPRNAT